jgi:hypothetical protein
MSKQERKEKKIGGRSVCVCAVVDPCEQAHGSQLSHLEMIQFYTSAIIYNPMKS